MIRKIVNAAMLIAAAFVISVPTSARAMVKPTKVLSNYETATGHRLARDCGYSAQLPSDPGQALFIFCDTMQYDENGDPYPAAFPFWPGTFAAVGPYTPGEAPQNLSHLPTPGKTPTLPNDNGPQLFLPNPQGLTDTKGQPCMYSATWALGLEQGPAASVTLQNGENPVYVEDASNLLFVSYMQVCVVKDPNGNWNNELDFIFKKSGVAAYDFATNSFVANTIVFNADEQAERLPWERQLFHPVFTDEYMYLYAYNCDNFFKPFAACLQGRAATARVSLGSIHDGTAYEYQTATGWTTDYTAASDVLGNSGLGTLALDVGDFTAQGRGYLLMEQTSYGGHYKLWQSATPAGPWKQQRNSRMASCSTGAGNGCYHLWSHAEMSTDNKLMYSIHDMANGSIVMSLIDDVPHLQ